MLSRLFAAAGMAALQGEVAAYARRTKRRAILLAVAALLWLLAFSFAIAALTVWLSELYGAIVACGILAGASAFVAVILHLIAAAQKGRRRSPQVASLLDAVPGKTPEGTTFGLLAIVAVAGYVLGRNVFRR
jgi:hypothetical protein